ncbi:DUF368 domain-containing protein [Tetragenococcus koreensis]|uniref:Membrane protein n=1 Tax=Tetragenococcus koreensis TaxID=290335 RepID=A0AAN4UAJ5_9ENTE|nr:DUF368 domain-containing protein [Tetragenococcus koreensis]MCF1616696.1 DUF368 domain-containing protein [Tetragenococcus koreensis]MCF1619063.1 DUF368 domain-containing protein [Tetragenococcus koreensis]MCF1621637.1 DUF368 domain-containing protein [Tetragenococcus koreensis]MCF1627015.1 DUF368 domain-containing protein [Tetragenococcus koreensis]MCF1630970.1 DUF368 domain-containing protein [Tetragenococcus koreensis]
MNYFWMIIKGMMMGIANIIPGVSGGTMAVSLGIYDDMIFAITHLFKKWKKSFKILLPLGIGLVAGVIFFSYAIEFLLSRYTLPTALAFVGLILGGLPILFRKFQASMKQYQLNLNISHIIVFLAFFAIVVGMSFMQETEAGFTSLEVNFTNIIVLFVIGIIASATMVVPGISGSLVLMILGYYYGIINTLTNFFDALRVLDWEALVYNTSLLLPFGIGVLLGIFLISKIIEYLFIHHPSLTYSGILGLVIASPFAIIYNTNALADLSGSNALSFTIIGIVLLVISFYLTYKLGKTEEPTTK